MTLQGNNRQVRLRFTRASTLTLIAVTSALTLSLVALGSLRLTRLDLEHRTQQAMAQAAALERRNEYLLGAIDALGTVNGIRQIARSELGLVDPGSIVFHNQSN